MAKPQAPEILLIEKDEITLDLYQRELSKSFNVLAFTDLDGVLETLATRDIRIVIIEPETCTGQGWDLIDTIHREFPDRSIPVIVCSTRDESSQNRRKHVSSYLTKPVLPKTLHEKTLEIVKS
jgi:DNA-binding response OmpR family regulator